MAPPVLDPSKSRMDGLAFLGLSLTRKSPEGHPQSRTHQTVFDLNDVIDREYKYVSSTNEDGWLVGGGEPGPPKAFKLGAPDSAHVQLMHIGTYNKLWGGLPKEDIVEALKSCKILIPEITVVPTAVVTTDENDIELRFDMAPAYHEDVDSDLPELPVNWQLRFVHNQLFRYFNFASRYCPNPFHATLARNAEFYSPRHRELYLDLCDAAVLRWRSQGPKSLNPPVLRNVERIESPRKAVWGGVVGSTDEYKSGVWLSSDRNTITHLFQPNFLPPYNTPAKRRMIIEILAEEWDEDTLTWKEASPLPKPQIPVKEEAMVSLWDCGLFDGTLCA